MAKYWQYWQGYAMVFQVVARVLLDSCCDILTGGCCGVPGGCQGINKVMPQYSRLLLWCCQWLLECSYGMPQQSLQYFFLSVRGVFIIIMGKFLFFLLNIYIYIYLQLQVQTYVLNFDSVCSLKSVVPSFISALPVKSLRHSIGFLYYYFQIVD